MRWMLPDAELRRRKLHKLFEALTRHHHLARGGVEVAPDGSGIGGAALWDPPGGWRQTRLEELRATPSLLMAFGTSLRRGLIADEVMKANHPEEPHWYLAIIGTDPDVRGKGFGNVLMQSAVGPLRHRARTRLPGVEQPRQRALLRAVRVRRDR